MWFSWSEGKREKKNKRQNAERLVPEGVRDFQNRERKKKCVDGTDEVFTARKDR